MSLSSSLTPESSVSSPQQGWGGLFKLNSVTVMVLMFIFVAFMGVLSLTHLNAMSTQGYLINELESKHQDLMEDGEINAMLVLQARSLEHIQESEKVHSMIKPEHVYYLDALTGLAQTD